MISKREEADRQFSKITGKDKLGDASSKSRSITDAEKAARDLKTAKLRKQRETKEASEAGQEKGKR
jgi:hypothetical protein